MGECWVEALSSSSLRWWTVVVSNIDAVEKSLIFLDLAHCSV